MSSTEIHSSEVTTDSHHSLSNSTPILTDLTFSISGPISPPSPTGNEIGNAPQGVYVCMYVFVCERERNQVVIQQPINQKAPA